MKKKILSVLLIGVMVIGLTGCGKFKENYIEYDNGKRYTMEQIGKISRDNPIAFREKYCQMSATIVAKVTGISNETENDPNGNVYLEVYLGTTKAEFDYNLYKVLLSTIKKGDILKLSTSSISCRISNQNEFSGFVITNPTVERVEE